MIDLRTAKFSQELNNNLAQHPWDYTFLQVCRWMEAKGGHLPRIGEELHPQNELLRLGQEPSTVFAPREIASVRLERGRLFLRLFGLGLYGPSGPLPLHLTETIHERRLQKRDTTLADFLDMFHHRWLSLFYRAWAQGQAAAGLDRRNDERFSIYIASLVGHHPAAQIGHHPAAQISHHPAAQMDHHPASNPGQNLAEADPLPAHARLAAAGHLVRHVRNPAGVAATLEHYFAMPFRLEEYAFQWLMVEPEDRVRLGRQAFGASGTSGISGILGRNAVLGRHIPDRQYAVTLHARPPDLPTYERLLPGNPWHAHLTRWLRCFTGLELRWELRLALPAGKTPPCGLNNGVRLGRTSWLPARDPQRLLPGRCAQI